MEKQQERALLIGLNITTNVKKLDDNRKYEWYI